MVRRLLVDATHKEEMRVAVVDNNDPSTRGRHLWQNMCAKDDRVVATTLSIPSAAFNSSKAFSCCRRLWSVSEARWTFRSSSRILLGRARQCMARCFCFDTTVSKS